MKRRRLTSLVFGVIVLVALTTMVAGAVPGDIGTPDIFVRPGATANEVEIAARNITGSGVVGFTVYMRFDHSLGSIATVTTGDAFNALNCGFATSRTDPYPVGQNPPVGVALNGTCTTSIPTTGVVAGASGVALAKLTFACTSGQIALDLASGPPYLPAPYTELFDPDLNEYFIPDERLFDGTVCAPTAVSLSGSFNAEPISPASQAVAVWPLLLGGSAVIAGAAYALLRRNR